MFGFASLLEEQPLGFVARAAEDTLVYRIPEHAIRPVLERPAAVRFVVGSLSKSVRLLSGHERDPQPAAGRPVRELIRAPALVCAPDMPVQRGGRSKWSRPAPPVWSSISATGSGSSPTATSAPWWPTRPPGRTRRSRR